MANISKQTVAFATAVAKTELTGADVLVDKTGTLWIENNSVSPVTINLDGDGGTTVIETGVGVVDVSGGYDVTVEAGEVVPVQLATISQYLRGTVAVTGGTADVFVWLI